MMVSNLYTVLSSRIAEIENHLLPVIDPNVGATAQDLDFIRSYCLLCHAEFEYYIEQSILIATQNSMNKWQANNDDISSIIFSLGFSNNESGVFQTKVNKAFIDLKKKIEKNNGIKEHNLIPLTKPIGFAIDPTLQTILGNFGATRGNIAHNAMHTQQPLDAPTQKNVVGLILNGLKTFDLEMQSYESKDKLNRNPLKIFSKLTLKERFRIFLRGY